MFDGRPYKADEQWMRLQRLRLEFRMKLACQKPGMIGYFNYLNEIVVRRFPCNFHPIASNNFLIFTIKLIAVAVALKDFPFSVDLIGQ